MRATLEVVATWGFTLGPSKPDPAVTETSFLVGLGPRWSPFHVAEGPRRGFDAAERYLQADVGYSQLLHDSDVVAHGFVVGGSIGWLPYHGRDWDVGIELTDELTIYNASVGVRQNVGLLLVIRLGTWP